jgi:hypothetical protein
MMDVAIDGLPMIRCAWPETGGDPARNGPIHTIAETADHLVALGYPRYGDETVRQIEARALAKLRRHPAIKQLFRERSYA